MKTNSLLSLATAGLATSATAAPITATNRSADPHASSVWSDHVDSVSRNSQSRDVTDTQGLYLSYADSAGSESDGIAGRGYTPLPPGTKIKPATVIGGLAGVGGGLGLVFGVTLGVLKVNDRCKESRKRKAATASEQPIELAATVEQASRGTQAQ